MRNNYIVLTLCLGLLSVNGLSQNAYVTGNQKVKVNPNTLVYFGSDLQINAAANDPAVVENAGNIYVNGDFVNHADPDYGKNFVSTWDDDSYGQVIIKQTSSADGLTMEKGVISTDAFNWGQFAIPFKYSTANDAMLGMFGVPYVSSSRHRSSMMLWDNTVKPQFKTVFGSTPLKPGDYVILNLTYYSAGIREFMETNEKLEYSGKPSNGALSGPTELVMNAGMYFHGEAWDTWKEYKNNYGEKYKDYISDEVRELSNDHYARNHFQFGNPYTSNLDLSKLPDIDTEFGEYLVGVAQYKEVDWNQGTGSSYPSSVRATYDGSGGVTGWAGDAEALIVKPFEPFILVLDENITGEVKLSFGDNLKTFSMVPHYTPSANKTSSDNLGGNSDFAGKNQYTGATLVGSLRGFYQLELKLYDEAENFTGNKAFVVVSDKVANGVENRLEAEYGDFGNRTGFYLAQENANGSPVAESSRKMYINTVGMSYNNKPIPFFFARKSGDHNGYYIKANLFKDNIFNKLTSEERNYVDGNSFYFYDFKEDKLIPITTDFKYYVPGSTVALENRYQIYWNGLQNHNKSELSEDLSTVVVYKDQDTHKVRFSEDWDNAEVKVYDLTGRKVLEFNNVSTKADFAFKLPANGIYVVKIVSNTGEVYTQKIIK